VLNVSVVVYSRGEEVVVPLQAIADFVRIDALLEIEAWKILGPGVLDMRVCRLEALTVVAF
jgi:hypothetical protein